MDANNKKYDFGETTKIDDSAVESTLKLEDYLLEKK